MHCLSIHSTKYIWQHHEILKGFAARMGLLVSRLLPKVTGYNHQHWWRDDKRKHPRVDCFFSKSFSELGCVKNWSKGNVQLPGFQVILVTLELITLKNKMPYWKNTNLALVEMKNFSLMQALNIIENTSVFITWEAHKASSIFGIREQKEHTAIGTMEFPSQQTRNPCFHISTRKKKWTHALELWNCGWISKKS